MDLFHLDLDPFALRDPPLQLFRRDGALLLRGSQELHGRVVLVHQQNFQPAAEDLTFLGISVVFAEMLVFCWFEETRYM